MKVLFSIVQAVLFVSAVFSQDETEDIKYIYPDHAFENGSTEFMYGNNVVLRADQTPESKALDTLRIGDPVTIIKKGETTSDVNGRPSYWYKVRANNKTGYVLGGWISLDSKEINGKKYLVIFSERDERLYARTRVVSKDKSYYGHEIELSTYLISVDITDNHGLKEVDAIFVISMHAEACGVVGGQAFLFDSGERLFEAIRTSRVSEAGLFWFKESIEFKGPDYWEDNIVYFSSESGEYMDDSMDWTKSVTNTVKLTWNGQQFTPDVRKLNFEESESH